nr:hypothetical protein [Tanacetum cinerariifolium]
MIGSLMYLTASRPDIQFFTCLCSRYQANLKESHLVAAKRIFRFLNGTPNLAFEKILEDIHVTWTHLEKKRTRLQLYTKVDEEDANSDWRRRHKYWRQCYNIKATMYVVPTGRVVVPTGRAVPAGRDVPAGKAVPAGRVVPAAQWSESSSSITSSSDTEIAALKVERAEINKNLMRVLQVNQQVKAVNPNCETCGGPHSFSDCPATVGNIQNIYVAGAYQGNSYQPQGNRNLLSYRSDNYLGPPGFNQNQNRNTQNQNFQNQKENQGNFHPQGNNQGRNQFFQGANQGQNPPSAYQAPAYQALGYQAPVHQPQIPQPQVITTNEFTNFIKANNVILKNMQTNMTSLTNSNLELKNMFGQFMKMNTTSSSGSGTLPGNTITNPKEELKGITTRSGTAYQGPTIPTTSSLHPVVECETEVTKDTVHPTNNGSTKDVQPSVIQTESPILNSEPVIAPIIE